MSLYEVSRRKFLKGLGAAAGTVFLCSGDASYGLALEESCPQIAGKEIRVIVPNSPGGLYDTYVRLLVPLYEKKLDARLTIENRQGAGTILGSNALKAAAPNGRTIGLLSSMGLLVAAMAENTRAPHPVKDFTILGRVTRLRQVWATGSGSPFKTIDDILEEANKRPIIFSITEVGATNFVNVAVTSWLLGIDPQFVAGYRGGWKSVMGVVRGEVDLIAYPTDVLKPLVKAGDMRLLLQVSEAPISSDPLLKGVPLLGGGNGLAASRAAALGRDVEEAIADAAALAGLVDGDQLIAAPRGLEEGIFRYLETKLYQALTDPGYKAALDKLGWPLDVARADVALAEVKAAEKSSEKFIPLVREAIKKAQR